jgi:hypothetical protein
MTDIGSRVSRRRACYALLAAFPLAAGAIATFMAMQPAGAALAQVGLGTANSFAVLAGSTVTNTGVSHIGGDVGVSPGSAVTGFPPGIVTGGSIHAADMVAAGAQSDLTTAYNNAAGLSPSGSIGPFIGAGQTLTPGVYDDATTSLEVGGSLTLDAQGDPSAVWVFQASSSLITDSASNVILTNGAQACNVFWQVTSSATLGTHSHFQGSILALTSITVTTGDTVVGRALARNGAVTLDTDRITAPGCAPTATPSATTVTPTGTGTGTGTGTASGTATPTATITSTATPTRPAPTPNTTSPGLTPTPTRFATPPAATPSPTHFGPPPATPAPVPSPVGTPFPVTG